MDKNEFGIHTTNGGQVTLQAGQAGIDITTISNNKTASYKGGIWNEGGMISINSSGNIDITGKIEAVEFEENAHTAFGIYMNANSSAITTIHSDEIVTINAEGKTVSGISVQSGILNVEGKEIIVNATGNNQNSSIAGDTVGFEIYNWSSPDVSTGTLKSENDITFNIVNNNQIPGAVDSRIVYGVSIVGISSGGAQGELSGKNVAINVTNNGINEAVGIGVQNYSKSSASVQAAQDVIIDVKSKDVGSTGIVTFRGNVDIEAGRNTEITAQILDNKSNASGYAVFAGGESQHNPDDVKTDTVTITSTENNTLKGSHTAIYATDASTGVTVTAKKGANTLKSEKDSTIHAETQSDISLFSGTNKLFAGKDTGNGFFDGNAIYAMEGATVNIKSFEESKNSNIVHGSILAKDTYTTITLENNSNAIYSANIVKDESNVDGVRTDRITSAIYAKDGGVISITGNATEEGQLNTIATSIDESQSSDTDILKERTVWAENGTIAINGRTLIHASNGSINDTNSVGIAFAAGASRVEGNPEEETKPFSGVINANLSDGSYIYGDMLAGNGGLLNIYKGAGSEITTFSNEGQAIQDATIQGNALSGNGGELNLKLGANTYWAGRADDYQDADSDTWKNDHTNIFTPEFSNTVESSGSINIELDGAYWEVTGQSWVTSISGNGGTIDLINNDDPNGAQSHALHVGNLTGSHNFVVNLDKNHTISDMLYIHDVGTGEGDTNMYTQHVVINNIEGIE